MSMEWDHTRMSHESEFCRMTIAHAMVSFNGAVLS
jgi:hypothetical protein